MASGTVSDIAPHSYDSLAEAVCLLFVSAKQVQGKPQSRLASDAGELGELVDRAFEKYGIEISVHNRREVTKKYASPTMREP